ncbi:hypothetical protein M1K46_05580 [Fictibacillus sp. WQ 8-8]|uniref:hypothetical protein n=1 Tax=Fictibacillus sp. WQ 8-8 TaxID=2938788 RepID=UPI002109C58C|nr:hypothetical protein [Fictibacillus sp. WQ 8-8]MCQ6265134.1 hypothetical protein [Fictibacillus sp. WQ 8-8]
MMKKSGFILVFFVLSMLIPTTAHAGWDYQGSDVFTKQSKNFKSGGGSFKFCLSKNSKEGNYRMMEEDPFNPDDWVSYEEKDPTGYEPSFPNIGFDSKGCVVYHNISKYVDGTDGQAELYIQKWSGGNSKVYAYD